MTESGVRASVGFFSDAGPRADNEDFAGAVLGWELPAPRRDVVAAIADGIGGTQGGRVASEIAVRGFLDGYCDLPETTPVQRAGAGIASALNNWIHTQGHRDPALRGMGCTFTALVLRDRVAHILHVGDTRAYRLSEGRLALLTVDHVLKGTKTLSRALGVEADLRLDYIAQPVMQHDRFLLCSDGVHGSLAEETIAMILRERSAPEDTARSVVSAALQRGSMDNCTALLLDVVRLPGLTSADVEASLARLPLIGVPSLGQTVDGFVLKALISDGRFSRLFLAVDESKAGMVLKFPKPQAATDEITRAAFLREVWVGELVNSPFVGRVLAPSPNRQSCLYTVMPFYEGELLETRSARRPAIGLEEGREIAIKLARGAAAMHSVGIIHGDIKPDNVILENGGRLKLIDFGVARVPELENGPSENVGGTLAYMAPEISEGKSVNQQTDIYSLGVTLFRAFTGEFPYANLDAVSPSRRERPQPLSALRPDLPAWLDAALARAIARNPAERFAEMTIFAAELEAGPARIGSALPASRTFYDRAPVLFWQIVAALLAFALILTFLKH
jgi:serine/threonine protein phosphatase PrpC